MSKPKRTRPPVSSEDFYSQTFAEDPQLHPKENLATYIKMTPEYKGKKYTRQLHLIDLATGTDRAMTTGGGGSDYMPRWAPDGKNLAFISARGGKPQVHLLPEKWGEPMPVTSVANGVGMYEWSPDSKNILIMSRTRQEERDLEDNPPKKKQKPDPRQAKLDGDEKKYQEEIRVDPRVYFRTVVKQGTAFRDDRNSHIYIQPVDGGAARRLTNGDNDYGPFSWSPDGEWVFASTSARATDADVQIKSDIVKINVESGEMAYLTDGDDGDFCPKLSKDGQWIYYMSFQNTRRYQQRMRLMRVPVAGGAVEDMLGDDFDLDPSVFQFDDAGEYLYFAISYKGRDSIARLPVNGGEMEYVVRDNGMVTGFNLQGTRIIYSWESPELPGEILIKSLNPRVKAGVGATVSPDDLPLVSGKVKQLTSLNKAFLKKRSLSLPQEVWIDRPDGTRIQGWYMLPHGYEEGKKYPFVVQVHGGPHVMWGWSWWHEFQSMCAKGYGVYFSNPRGSHGYGHAFKGAIHKEWGEKDSLDILAGADLMVEMGVADADRLYLTGGSFGGFMTGWLVTHDHRFKAAVAQRGVYNFISMYGASDALTLVEWEFDTLPWKNTELLWDRSPLKYVENVTTPTMVLHSELDFRVGISQAEEFYTALKRCGKEACFVRYPREGHELSRSGEPLHRVDRINKIIGWFDEHGE